MKKILSTHAGERSIKTAIKANTEASKGRDAIFIGCSAGFGLKTIFVVLAAFFPDVMAGAIWTVVVINLLFAIAFFLVGRASMSTSGWLGFSHIRNARCSVDGNVGRTPAPHLCFRTSLNHFVIF